MNQQKLGTVMYNLKRAEDVFDRIKNDRGDCKLVSSNLRRAMATAAIGFGARLRKTGEKIQIVPYLQEITRNIDAVCARNRDPEEHSRTVEQPTNVAQRKDQQY